MSLWDVESIQNKFKNFTVSIVCYLTGRAKKIPGGLLPPWSIPEFNTDYYQ